MKIPNAVFRQAKSAASKAGITLRQFVTEAMREKLEARSSSRAKPWLKSFGSLRHLHKETVRINRLIEEEFEQIEEP